MTPNQIQWAQSNRNLTMEEGEPGGAGPVQFVALLQEMEPGRGGMNMKRFVPREKLGKKARKQLDSEQRASWAFSPVTKKVESKKLYNRKR